MYKGACLAVHRDARGRHRSRLADAASKDLLIEAEFAALPAHPPSLSCRCRAASRQNLRVIAFLSQKRTEIGQSLKRLLNRIEVRLPTIGYEPNIHVNLLVEEQEAAVRRIPFAELGE